MMVDPWACLLGALLLLLLPLPWLLAAAAAAAFHELCHIAAVYALGGRICRITVGVGRTVMETALPGRGRQLLAALAGPAGSLMLILLARAAPHIALCGAVQGLFNLLPLYPLDGGRVLHCILEGRIPDKGLRLLEGGILLAAALAVLRWSAFFAAILAVRAVCGKIPCKLQKIGVQ